MASILDSIAMKPSATTAASKPASKPAAPVSILEGFGSP